MSDDFTIALVIVFVVGIIAGAIVGGVAVVTRSDTARACIAAGGSWNAGTADTATTCTL